LTFRVEQLARVSGSLRAIRFPGWSFERAFSLPVAALAIIAIGPFVAWTIAEESWRLLALIILAGLIPLALRWPIVTGFGAYAFIVPFDAVSGLAGGASTITKLLGMAAVVLMLTVGVVRNRIVRPPLAALWVALLIGWGAMTLVWAVNLDLAEGRVPTAVSLVAMYFVAVSFRVSATELKGVCLLAMLGGALAATAGVLLGFEATAGPAARGTLTVAGQHVNPNAVAESLILPLAMAVAIFVASRAKLSTGLAVGAIGAIGAAIFLTMSRASLLALAIMMAVFLFRLRSRLSVLAVAVLAALLPLMPELFFYRITSVFTGEDATGAGRTDIWATGLLALDRFGWLGAGLSNFPHTYNMYAPGTLSKGAHNTYLGTWVELGIIGVVLLLAAFFAHLRLGKRSDIRGFEPFPVAIQAACVGMFVIAFFGDILWSKFLWVPWILAVWASRIEAPPN
jgi:O-antigen ligase